MVGSPEAIRALVERPLASSGVELWDVEITRDTVRILIDRPGGVDLDALAEVAGGVVSPLLDGHPELTPDGQFSLEVSSPGVERPLRRTDQYSRYIGTEISVKTRVAVDGARRHQGRLVSVDDQGIVLAPSAAPDDRTLAIAHRDIDRARTMLAWGPAEKPGHGVQRRPASTGQQRRRGGQATRRHRPCPGRHPVASREKETE